MAAQWVRQRVGAIAALEQQSRSIPPCRYGRISQRPDTATQEDVNIRSAQKVGRVVKKKKLEQARRLQARVGTTIYVCVLTTIY